MRKMIPVFLMALLLSVFSGWASDFRCTTNNGQITITGYIGSGGDIVIPDTINGLTVTRIADRAFERNTLLTGVTIANSVTNIGNYAFQSCNQLAYAELPSNLVSIGTSAFNGCSLSEITFPEGLLSIGQQAFYSCRMSSVHIPASVTNIVRGAFASRTNLTAITVDPLNNFYSAQDGVLFNAEGSVLVYYPAGKSGSVYAIPDGVSTVEGQAFWGAPVTDIIIPPSVTNLAVYAFYGMAQLTNAVIPESVTSIGNWAFYLCRSLTEIIVDENNPSYSSLDGVLFNKDQTVLIQCPQAKAGAYVIPDSVTAVGNYAFFSCSGLTDVVLPDGLISLGSYAFYNCNGLTEFLIPASVESIGSRAFSICSSLTAINVDENNGLYSSLDGVLFNKAQTLLIQYPQARSGSYEVPDGVERIGSYAFQSALDLPDISFPDSLSRIDNDSFYGCSGLSRVDLSSGVTNIGARAFSNCRGLTEISVDPSNPSYSSAGGVLFNKGGTTLIQYPAGRKGSYAVPSGVTAIGINAFFNCDELTSLRIPDSTVNLQSQAFADCNKLTDLYFEGNYPSTVSSPLFALSDSCAIHYLQTGTGWGASFMGRPSSEGPVHYLLTVEGGTGGGFYTNQQAVAVTADRAPERKIFDRWVGDTQQLTEVAVSPAVFLMEARDAAIASTYQDANALSVAAARGAAEPPEGRLFYPIGHALTCSVPETVIEQGILWRCTGWTGTGSVPASGSTHTTGEIFLNNSDSSIIWLWETDFSITNVAVLQLPGTKLVEITYDIISDVTNGVPIWLNVIEEGGKHIPVYMLSGDAGDHIVPGTKLRMVWDMGQDWDKNQGELSFIVRAAGLQEGMVLIPSGTNSGTDPDYGTYNLTVNSFYMDATSVTKAQWDDVYTWAIHADRGDNAYSFDREGSGKAANHPVHSVNWYDAVKWCNARSEMEGRTPCYSVSNQVYRSGSYGTNGADVVVCDFDADGYRLPTVIEHQYASRGGLRGKRFPWGDTITHDEANYLSTTDYDYDISMTSDYHPDTDGPNPRTLPVKSFAPNDYGLYDMAGNIVNWCWEASADGRRRNRGGHWGHDASRARCGSIYISTASVAYSSHGFRTVSMFASTGSSVCLSEPANAVVDTRDYLLMVESAQGHAVPPAGTRTFAWGSIISCTVPETVIEQGILWRNTGWTGTGSVPASGTTHSTGEIALTDLESSITWHWETSFSITNVAVQQRPGTKLVDITYDIISDVTNGVPVYLIVEKNGKPLPVYNLSGDAGLHVLPGGERQIVWDMGNEWDENFGTLIFTVRAGGLPQGMVLIPAGSNIGTDPDGSYSLTVNDDLAMDQFEVTKAQWDSVYAWAVANGYAFDNPGTGKAGNHPVYRVNWYDSVKWLNARSEMEHLTPCYSVSNEVYRTGSYGTNGSGNVLCNFEADGYRLPTRVEWQYGARGGQKDLRFPWGDTVTHENANYRSTTNYSYDVSLTRDYHPDTSLPNPRTLPAGSFTANRYGLYDMAGNVREWCWDASGENRYMPGGDWNFEANRLRCRYSIIANPSMTLTSLGLRSVRSWNDANTSGVVSQPMSAEVDSQTYYALTVSSDRGQTDPETGLRSYLPGSTMTLSAPETVVDQGVLWNCAGWTGTGSVPESGETNTTGELVLTNLESSITWHWETDFAITNVVAQQRPGTKLVDITYDIVSEVTNGVHIVLFVERDGRRVAVGSLSGDVGEHVLPGMGRKIVWDAGEDWTAGQVEDLTFIVTVNNREIPPAPVAKTGQTASYREGDDGWHQAGIVCPAPRFTDNGDGTVTDHLTGLMWVKEPHAVTSNGDGMVWQSAVEFCNGLSFANRSDWRLPNVRELDSLMQYRRPNMSVQAWLNSEETPFSGVLAARYWTATSQELLAWNLFLGNGAILLDDKSLPYFAWPVCTAKESLSDTMVPKTGQKISYLPGDDGDYQFGLNWPEPRFTEKNSKIVTDRLTGLEWILDPHSLPGNENSMNWNDAIDFCNNLEYMGFSDWRLPNRKELMSLLDYGGVSNALPIGIPINGLDVIYWTGTSTTNMAWRVSLSNGEVRAPSKDVLRFVLPVRHNLFSARFTGSVIAQLDTRNYILTVSSERGQPAPESGSHAYLQGSMVTLIAPETVIEHGILWRCTGWTGTGSVPASGTTNTTGEILLANLDSSITWHWETDFAITNVVAQQRPGTKRVDITYDIISELTNGVSVVLRVKNEGVAVDANSLAGDAGADVLPGTGRQIIWDAGADWNLNRADLTFQIGHAVHTQLCSSVHFVADTLDYNLTVRSDPDSGVSVMGSRAGMTPYSHALAYATNVELIVPLTYERGSDRMRFAGWSGSITSSALIVNLTVTNNQEVTVHYGLERTLQIAAPQKGRIDPAGTVAAAQGYPQTFTATPDHGYRLKHWLVDGKITGKDQRNLTVDVTGNMTIAAVFEPVWLVFEGRSRIQQVDPAGGKNNGPALMGDTLSTVLIVNRDRFGETNAVLVSWGRNEPQAEAVSVDLDDRAEVAEKRDKAGKLAAERKLWSLQVQGDGGRTLLLGRFDGAYRYDRDGLLSQAQQRASLSGAGVEPEEPGYSSDQLRLNQTAGDALNTADGDYAQMAATLRAAIKKLPAGLSAEAIQTLLQQAAGGE